MLGLLVGALNGAVNGFDEGFLLGFNVGWLLFVLIDTKVGFALKVSLTLG